MILGYSTDAWAALGTVLGAVGTLGLPVVSWVAAGKRAQHRAELAAAKAQAEKERIELKAQFDAAVHDLTLAAGTIERDLGALKTSVSAAWQEVHELRVTSVPRAEQEKLRDEFRSDLRAMGDRLEGAINALRNDLHGHRGAA
jgi:hypothetical protein